MSKRQMKRTAAALVVAALVGGVCASAQVPQTESTVTKVPGVGGVAVNNTKASATIKAINAETRDITLETTDGRTETFKAGPAVRNFDQLAVGDKVNVTLTEAVAVYLGKEEQPSADAGGVVARAPVGGTPGGLIVGGAQITAKVTELDKETRHATLQLPDNITRKVKVRDGIDLSKVQVGDSVTIAIVEGMAIDVEKPQATE
jgi:hypothetical protein